MNKFLSFIFGFILGVFLNLYSYKITLFFVNCATFLQNIYFLIVDTLGALKSILYNWQSLAGSLIGASTPFILWLLAERHKEKQERKKKLYYLQRILVGQINSLLEIKETLNIFSKNSLQYLINELANPKNNNYYLGDVFLPLFSVTAIPEDVNKVSSGSGYIDNRLAKTIALSKDLVHIIEDARHQLNETLKKNETISLAKLNTPIIQNNFHRENIINYKKALEEEIIGKNIPIYLKSLVESLVPIEHKTRIGYIRWKLKFQPEWNFFKNKKSLNKAKEGLYENMSNYFKPLVAEKMEEIERLVNKTK